MNEIIGEQIKYILVQTNTENENKQAVFYNDYNMSLSTVVNVDQATKFEDLEMAQGVVSLQNQMALLFKKGFRYDVVEEHIVRKLVEEPVQA